MTRWADQEYGAEHSDRELVRFAVSGQGAEWGRLREKIFAIVDTIAKRVEAATDLPTNTLTETTGAMKDLTSLTMRWAEAKVERPSIENEKLRAEIASEFAEAKRRHAEALKAEAEARKTDVDTRNASLIGMLDALERLMKLGAMMAHMTFERVGNDGHLLIGPRPQQLGEPGGSLSSPDERPPSEG